jgi:Secretion system C-terminal sorting domain
VAFISQKKPMKKLHLLLFFVPMVGMVANAQVRRNTKNLKPVSKLIPAAVTGFETSPANAAASHNTYLPTLKGTFRGTLEVTTGTTMYDLQTNASTKSRITNDGKGHLSTAWTQSHQATGYTDRGTGYNHREPDGTWWNTTDPTTLDTLKRLESVRNGFTNVVTLSDGTDVTVAHIGAGKLVVTRRAAGAKTVTESLITAATTTLWPTACSGGSDGKTVHVVSVSIPTASGGTKYKGVDGNPLYFRSKDGGLTWDINSATLPGLDSTLYSHVGGDNYTIHANGNTVAILVTTLLGDVRMWKSTDNGTTWAPSRNVLDFPFDGYVTDTGWDSTMVKLDTLAPAATAIFGSNETGSVLVDNNGKVHCWYGEMYLDDSDTTGTAGSIGYFPTMSGIGYWNEDMPDNTRNTIATGIDSDSSGFYSVLSANHSNYRFSGLTAWPTTGIDKAGNLFCAYSAEMENLFETTSGADHRLHHILMTTSNDGGKTWTAAEDLITDKTSDPDNYQFYECVFPSMARNVDKDVHILYQQDFIPGSFLQTANGLQTESTNNAMVYLAIPNVVKSGSHKVKFSVDLGANKPDPAGVHLAGNLQKDAGFAGDWDPATTALTQEGTTTIWSVELTLPSNKTYEYKFVNGKAWGGDESMTKACAAPGGTNRFFTTSDKDEARPLVCFKRCFACDEAAVTLSVNMVKEKVDPALGVHVAGAFQGWSPGKTALVREATPNANHDIWTITVPMKAGDQEYKFINGNDWGKDEVMNPATQSCAKAGGTNRYITVDAAKDAVNAVVCFKECKDCIVAVNELDFNTGLSVSPNPTSGIVNLNYKFNETLNLNVRVLNLLGQVITDRKLDKVSEGTTQFDLGNLANGMYIIQVTDGVNRAAKRVSVQK